MTQSQNFKSAPNSVRNLDVEKPFPNRKLSVREAAAFLNVSTSWLNKRRLDGKGPLYAKMSRRVTYSLDDLELFVASMKRRHTSEPTLE
jgi:hypothetical protein